MGGGGQGGAWGGGAPGGSVRGGGGYRCGNLGWWVQVGRFGVLGGEGGHRLPLPPLALPLTVPSP